IISIGDGCSPVAMAEALTKQASKGEKELSPGILGAAPTTWPNPRTVPNVAMMEFASGASNPIKANLLPANDCLMIWSMGDSVLLAAEKMPDSRSARCQRTPPSAID